MNGAERTGSRSQPGREHGFTLLEVILVFILIGIVAAFAVSRGNGLERADLYGQEEAIKNHLRYAQTLAMSSNTIYGLDFLTASSYRFYRLNPTTKARENMVLPGVENPVVLPSGVSVSVGGGNIVSYDEWGQPYTNEAGTTVQSAARTITVSMGGESRSFTITPNTGFIP